MQADPGEVTLPDARIPQLSGREIAAVLEPLRERLAAPLPAGEAQALGVAAIGLCRRLYSHARSRDAVPLARAVVEQAARAGDPAHLRRALTACGLVLGDAGDVVGAIEHHARALRMAEAEGDRAGASRIWNNIGLTFAIAGNNVLAMRCHQRAACEVEGIEGPVYSRYASLSNAANSCFHLGEYEEGLRLALRALAETTPAFLEEDPHGGILLRRNLVYLLLANGRTAEAQPQVEAIMAAAATLGTQRSRISEATARAAYEIATGQDDIALTRLDKALSMAREVPGVLRHTLACVIRGEEAAGHADRALMRLQELADHVYRSAIDRARGLIGFEDLALQRTPAGDAQLAQATARLRSKAARRVVPDGWDTLRRLAIGAAMRVDRTGWHGIRVGALTKAHALAHGCGPLEALEIGLAAEVHDIGLSSVPEAIFAKSGEPTDVERALILRHADAGAEILRDDRQPRMLVAREIARYHHARWDGLGYPERVSGHAIPLPARLVAIADAYDDWACGTEGRAPVSMAGALANLRMSAGTEFDPDLVDSFESMVRSRAHERDIDPSAAPGLENFQQLIASLEEDRGFV